MSIYRHKQKTYEQKLTLRKNIAEKIQEVAELRDKGGAFKDNLLVDAFSIGRLLMQTPKDIFEFTEARDPERIREYLINTLLEFGDGDVWVACTKRIWEYLTDTLSELEDDDVWAAHSKRIREYLTDTLSEVIRDGDVWVARTKRIRKYLVHALLELEDGDEWVAHTERIREYLTDTLLEVGNGDVTERFQEYLTDKFSKLKDDAVTELQEYSKLGDGAMWVAHTERIWENLTDTLSELRDDAGSTADLNEFRKMLEDVEKPIYPSCSDFTKLSAFVTSFNFKVRHQLSNTVFDELLEILGQWLANIRDSTMCITDGSK
ncbi:hypothetical protein RHSIM_Rhsim12G0067100 [Rhododendron simsii]|uniref:Uncharacterized protein n=1 Tax=Rhododendron simsii TaxID=118357 RepID=A0A834G4Y9_RHOSS|nr:hypothetical protein RHSIM_Rhsim12G0067100 [Rhododendron simsii]